MITEENIKELYKKVIYYDDLSTKDLKEIGFNSNDISNLIEEGYISRIKRGYYSFKATKKLFSYGKKLIVAKEYAKAHEVFKTCFELDPDNLNACFQLFMYSIDKKDYEAAFKYFETLAKGKNQKYFKDYNLYLYLLNIITEIPEKYSRYVKFLGYKDFSMYDDDRYKNISYQNKIISLIICKRFKQALNVQKEAIEIEGKTEARDILLRNLMYQATCKIIKDREYITNLIDNEQYDDVISYFEYIESKQKLNTYESVLLKLVDTLLDLERIAKIPSAIPTNSKNLFTLIESNNFELALKVCKESNFQDDKNHIESLLLKICSLITKLEEKREQYEEKSIEEEIKKEPTKKDLYRYALKLDSEYIEKEYEKLVTGDGLLILPPMDSARRERIHKIIGRYPDVVSFSIFEGYERSVVLRYRPHIEERLNLNEIYSEACLAYKTGDFNKALENFKKLLHFGMPNSKIYGKLGLTYMKKGKKGIAIKYLTVSTELHKIDGKGADFTSLIDKLKGVYSVKNVDFKMELDEFQNDLELNHGIINYEEIKEYVHKNGGFNIDLIRNEFNLTSEQLGLVILLYVRDLYSEAKYDLGDRILKLYEKSSFKTKENTQLYLEIKKNKKFYFNRSKENGFQLILATRK